MGGLPRRRAAACSSTSTTWASITTRTVRSGRQVVLRALQADRAQAHPERLADHAWRATPGVRCTGTTTTSRAWSPASATIPPSSARLSAKQLATTLHFMQGTPYIYQGEELGMTNVRFESIEDYRDGDSIRFYEDMHVDHQAAQPRGCDAALSTLRAAITPAPPFSGMTQRTVGSRNAGVDAVACGEPELPGD